jgi:L,D-transpeptidase YbiS
VEVFMRGLDVIKKTFFALSVLWVVGNANAVAKESSEWGNHQQFLELKSKHYQKIPQLVYINIDEQKLYYLENGKVKKTYGVSTSKYGRGGQKLSEKTPVGKLIIHQKIGEGLEINSIIFNQTFYDHVGYPPKRLVKKYPKYGSITSRVLWLAGTEKGVNKGGNVDVLKRYIYIHGTPKEHDIGKPVSGGCIRMKNKEVIELFDLVKVNTPVWIY